MKPILSLTLSLFLFTFITKFSLAFSKNDVEQILDLDGNPISSHRNYYILPAVGDPREDQQLRLEKTGNLKCPVSVLQTVKKSVKGIPVKFTRLGTSSDKIFTDTPLQIEFISKPYCAKSSKWLIFVDNVFGKPCVGIGGPENYPGMKISNGTFSIHKSKHQFGYTQRFCYKESHTCLDIDTSYDDNLGTIGQRFILSSFPGISVVFVYAGDN